MWLHWLWTLCFAHHFVYCCHFTRFLINFFACLYLTTMLTVFTQCTDLTVVHFFVTVKWVHWPIFTLDSSKSFCYCHVLRISRFSATFLKNLSKSLPSFFVFNIFSQDCLNAWQYESGMALRAFFGTLCFLCYEFFSMLSISMTSDDGENQKRIVMSSF